MFPLSTGAVPIDEDSLWKPLNPVYLYSESIEVFTIYVGVKYET